MIDPPDELESSPPPRRDWALLHLKPYLLGVLNPDEEDEIAEALFIYPGLSTALEETEHQLLEEFTAGTLKLDVVRNASLIRRWSTSSDTRAALEVLRWKDDIQKGEELVQQPRSVAPIRSNRAAWRWAAVVGYAASVVVLAVLLSQVYSLRQQNEQMAKTIAEDQRRVVETERIRRENEKLAERVVSTNAKKEPVPESPKTLTPAQREIIEAQLAGPREGSLDFQVADREIVLPSQQPLFWKVAPELAESYDVIVTKQDGSKETRHLKAFRGKVEIPIESDDLPARFSIRHRKTEETPVSNIKVVNAR